MNVVVREKKKGLCRQMAESWASEGLHRCRVRIHGCLVEFSFFDPAFALQIEAYFPCDWRVSHDSGLAWQLKLVSPVELQADGCLFVDPDPEIDLFVLDGGFEAAVQRDFCGVRFGRRAAAVFLPELSDGFHNVCRWLFPVWLQEQRKYLLHSSAVVDQDMRAVVFVGASGAGKTTLALKAREKFTVLGDDVNMVSWSDDDLRVEPAAVGQNDLFSPQLGVAYPVKGICFIEQSPQMQLVGDLGLAYSLRKISAQVHAAGFVQGADCYQKMIADLLFVMKKIPCFLLKTAKTTPIEEVFDELNQTLSQDEEITVAKSPRGDTDLRW